jgi:hypothetical protein
VKQTVSPDRVQSDCRELLSLANWELVTSYVEFFDKSPNRVASCRLNISQFQISEGKLIFIGTLKNLSYLFGGEKELLMTQG